MCECGLDTPHQPWESPFTLGRGFSDTPPATSSPKVTASKNASWKISKRSQQILDAYYGKLHMEPSLIDRCGTLLEIKGLKSQRDLIESRWSEFDDESRRWATRSLIHIASELRRLDDYTK